jgi:hypothetical protein
MQPITRRFEDDRLLVITDITGASHLIGTFQFRRASMFPRLARLQGPSKHVEMEQE